MWTLQSDGDLNDDQKELIDLAVKEGHGLLHIINNMMDIAKMEDGSLQLDYEEIDANELISSAIELIAPLARDKNLRLLREVDSGLRVSGDADLLRRTLMNLLGNAVKFTPRGGCVTVRASDDLNGGTVVFAVQDTGDGIPKEAFGRIFEKFGQVENGKRGSASTGLGLTFCKMVAEAHGGHVRVESELGQGSTFYAAFPASAHAVTAVPDSCSAVVETNQATENDLIRFAADPATTASTVLSALSELAQAA
jgi:signal transduction histidine kinase